MHLTNSVYDCNTQKELMQFYHATMLSPVKKTLLEAASWGYLKGWPGLTQAAIRKYIDIEDAMVKEHLNQVRQGICSSQEKHTKPECIQEPKNNKTNHVHATIADLGGVIYTDQMGQFPRVSSQENWYVMVVCCYDANYIECVPIKNKSESEFQQAYEGVYNMLTKKGYKAQLHKLDNETSQDLMEWIEEQQTEIHFTPPEMHQSNAAEKAVHT
eukprot:2949643-Ditylum_brightwellii.AAC.1